MLNNKLELTILVAALEIYVPSLKVINTVGELEKPTLPDNVELK